ncbi:MAG: GNAT family N-acetyltransferase [Minwuia sp.]|nr:GNAT family N-acetyltransferase [Minwuia sp.]
MDCSIALLADRQSALTDLIELFVAEWTPWYGPQGQGNAEADLVACMTRDRLPIAVVAQDRDGRVLGTAALKQESLGAELGYGPWLAAVVVVPAWRRQGIGSNLISAVEGHARALGFAEIYTSTNTANAIIARRGWQPLNHTVQSIRGPISIFRLALG